MVWRFFIRIQLWNKNINSVGRQVHRITEGVCSLLELTFKDRKTVGVSV